MGSQRCSTGLDDVGRAGLNGLRKVSLIRTLSALTMASEKDVQIASRDPNGVEDPKVGESASCAEPVDSVPAHAKDGGNFFDGQ